MKVSSLYEEAMVKTLFTIYNCNFDLNIAR